MSHAILYVDNQPQALEAVERNLHRGLDIRTALGPEEGLAALARQEHFAVVLADLCMPGMNGIQFLSRAKELSPDSVRMVLTGTADLDAALAAVNEGSIFRLLTKPCPTATLAAALEAAVAEFERRVAPAAQDAEEEGAWDWDLETQAAHFSDSWKAMLGYGASEIGDQIEEWFSRIHPGDSERVEVELATACFTSATGIEIEHRIRHKDGTYPWTLVRGRIERCPAGTATRIAGALTPVRVNRIYEAANGLLTLPAFKDELARSIHRAQADPNYLLAVLCLGLDGFKLVDDSLSQPTGEQLLVSVAKRLKSCIRGQDPIALPGPACTMARLAREEFVLLLDNVQRPENASRMAERILGKLESPFEMNDGHVSVTANIGIALGGAQTGDPEELLRHADLAMYLARTRARARYEFFSESMREAAVTRLRLEADLRRAVAEQEFRVHYQPQMLLEDGSIVGFEALVRWQHPERGLVEPLEYIPLAEETGLIIPIGEWVLRKACAQAAQWQKNYPAGQSLSVSVNLSPKQFRQPDLTDQIARILEETGLEASRLHLEITEGALMEDPESTLAALRRLKGLGVELEIDDFGTGYSSLNYLNRFPFNTIKIDRSFIRLIEKDEKSAEIVRTLIALGHNLGMRVIAEGLETNGQLAQLKSAGCIYAQGFYFSRAVEAAAAEGLIRRQKEAPGPERGTACAPVSSAARHQD